MAKLDLELKVGLFVSVGLVILIVFIFSIGKFYIFNPGYFIDVIFKYADGIAVSAPVRLAGYEVGEVKNAKIFYDIKDQRTKVEVSLWVKNSAKIEKDSTVYVNSLGFMGEKYIEIDPGTVGSELVKNNDTMIGNDSIPLRRLTDEGYKIMTASRTMMDSLNELLGGGMADGELKNASKDLGSMLKHASSILEKIDNGEGTLGKFLTDDSVYKNFSDFSEDIRKNPWKLLFKPKGAK